MKDERSSAPAGTESSARVAHGFRDAAHRCTRGYILTPRWGGERRARSGRALWVGGCTIAALATTSMSERPRVARSGMGVGVAYAVATYASWGLSALYFKLVTH